MNPDKPRAKAIHKPTESAVPAKDLALKAVRLLCVDDHAFLVEGLKAQFALEPDLQVAGRLSSAEHLLTEAARIKPDMVLLDIEMPGPDPFDMADRLRQIHPEIQVVFLSAHVRDTYISSAYKAGASGYFSKADEIEDIIKGLRAVASGQDGFALGPNVKTRIKPKRMDRMGHIVAEKGEPRATPLVKLDALSEREMEVVRLIGRGLSRTQIAEALSIRPKTVDGHQERILKKLSVESRADLMRFAIREGLVEA